MEQIKILLADDEEEFVKTLSERMQIKDLDSDFVLSGEQALESLGNEIPDVMVLDLRMPGIDGLEVLRRLKKDYPQVQVIILTGHGSDQDKRVSTDLGAFDYFVKPVDIDALILSIKKAYQLKIETYGKSNPAESGKYSTVSMKKKRSFLRDKVSTLSEKMDRYQEAITFAEADQHELAEKALQRETVKETPKKLVVVGNESEFSQEIIEYAMEMAKRMEFEIVALNTAPLSFKSSKLFSSSWKKICEEFQALSAENIKPFQIKAEAEGIGFTHAVDFVEIDDALKKLKSKYNEINLVVSNPEVPAAEAAAIVGTKLSRPKPGFLVYAMS